VRLARCEVRDHINYRQNDRWRSYRFYRASQRLKSPMRYICQIFGAPRFSSFSTQSARSGRSAHLSPSEGQVLWRALIEKTQPLGRLRGADPRLHGHTVTARPPTVSSSFADLCCERAGARVQHFRSEEAAQRQYRGIPRVSFHAAPTHILPESGRWNDRPPTRPSRQLRRFF
jgi:hypothetical protein